MNELREVGQSHAAEGIDRRPERLREACRQVEGLFLSQLLSLMSRPTWGEGMLGRSVGQEMFSAHRDMALAEEMGRRGELGLARMLYEQLAGESQAAQQPD